MKWYVCVAAAALAWTGLAAAQAPPLESMDIVTRSVPDGPIARVNGAPISATDFRDLYRGELERWAQMNAGEPVTDPVRVGIAIATMRTLIEQELLYQEATRRKITVSDQELQSAWAEEIERLRKPLARGGEPPSEEQILKDAGATREEALAGLKRLLTIDKVRGELLKEAKVSVSDAEIQKYYDEHKDRARRPEAVHLRQIFVRVTPARGDAGAANKAKAREKIDTALKRIQAGQSFEAVAKDVSEGQGKEQGGDIGTMPVDRLPPFLVEAARTLQPGQVSPVVESEYGFHLVKLVELTPGQDITLEQAKPMIERILLQDKMQEVVQKFCLPSLGDEKVVQEFLLRELEKQLAARPELLEQLRDAQQPASGAAKPTAKPPASPAPQAPAKPAPQAKPQAKPKAK